MPDDLHLSVPRRQPEDIDLGAIKADIEFLIERAERFRKEQALKPLYTMIGSAAIIGQVALSQRSYRLGRKPNFAASFLANFALTACYGMFFAPRVKKNYEINLNYVEKNS